MRVLIVGCGYVGLPLGAELVRMGHEVYGLRRSRGAEGELNAAGLKPLFADVSDPASLTVLPREFDWVVNSVASTRGGPEDYRKVYLEGTRNLIQWLSGSPLLKFVYTSSSGVYAQNDGSLVDETSPTLPETETGRVLVETEGLLRAAAQVGFPAIILRLAGIYGPGRGYYFKQFVAGEPIPPGAEGRILNMVHQEDVAGAIIAALERGRAGEVYNVVDDEPTTLLQFYQWMSQELGRPMPLAAAGATSVLSKRGPTNKVVSNGRLKAGLGYRFSYQTFREGFAAELAAVRRERQVGTG